MDRVTSRVGGKKKNICPIRFFAIYARLGGGGVLWLGVGSSVASLMGEQSKNPRRASALRSGLWLVAGVGGSCTGRPIYYGQILF